MCVMDVCLWVSVSNLLLMFLGLFIRVMLMMMMRRSWFNIGISFRFRCILAELVGLVYVAAALKEDEYGDDEYNYIHHRGSKCYGRGYIEQAYGHDKH